MTGSEEQRPDPVLGSSGGSKRLAWLNPRLLAVGGLALLLGGWLLGQVLVFDYLATPALNSSVAGLTGPARPDASLDVQLAGAGVGLDDVQLYRSDQASTSGSTPETPVSVEPQAGHAGDWTLVAPDGGSLLRPDGDYRLVVSALEPRPAFPLPRTEVVAREYRFTTVQAPKPDLAPTRSSRAGRRRSA